MWRQHEDRHPLAGAEEASIALRYKVREQGGMEAISCHRAEHQGYQGKIRDKVHHMLGLRIGTINRAPRPSSCS